MKYLSLFLFSSIVNLASFSQDSVSVLFIGNSYVYVNDLPLMVSQLTQSLGDEITFDSKTNGGFTFQNHKVDPLTHTKIQSKPWDFVVVQGQSQEPSFPTGQVNTASIPPAVDLADSVYSNKYCSQVMYFMTWGRENGDPQWDSINTFFKMNERLRNAYLRISDSAQACVAPAGVAWKYVRDNNPTIQLYSGDGSHPSIAGTYLSACTFYASLFRKSPVGASFLAGLDPATAGILQEAAALSVLDSLETWHLRASDETAIANFTAIQNGATIECTNSSWRATTYTWNFGDGNSSNDPNAVHTYTSEGDFTISLTAENECGSDTMYFDLTVNNLGLSNQDLEGIKMYNLGNNVYEFKTNQGQDLEIVSILNSLGQSIDGQITQVDDHLVRFEFNVAIEGMYIIQLRMNDTFFYVNLIK